MESKHFLSPRLTGNRFDHHSVPIEVLEDFAALQELLTELAKKIYLEDNPKRKRVPKGFTDGITLNLETVEEGSAILNFCLATSLLANSILGSDSHSYTYFEKAKSKVIQVIGAAEKENSELGTIVGKRYLNYFNRIGRNLQDGETIYLDPAAVDGGPKFDKSVRKNIILSITGDATYEDRFNITALIDSISKSEKTFTLIVDSQKITTKLDPKFYKTIIHTFSDIDAHVYVNIQGEGIYDKKDRLIRIESISTMDVLDAFDVSVRLDELAKLKDGWYHSEGLALSKSGLVKFEELFNQHYADQLPLPAIFPTIEGHLQLEWSLTPAEISVEVNLNTFIADYLAVNINDQSIIESQLDLNQAEGWLSLTQFLSSTNA